MNALVGGRAHRRIYVIFKKLVRKFWFPSVLDKSDPTKPSSSCDKSSDVSALLLIAEPADCTGKGTLPYSPHAAGKAGCVACVADPERAAAGQTETPSCWAVC